MASRRRMLPEVPEPPYDLELVGRCNRNMSGSVLIRVDSREVWKKSMGEMLQLCNEAAWRQLQKDKRLQSDPRRLPLHPHDPKPLMLEYIADRLDTDDPVWGYMVRTKRDSWLQGFITVTTFTTWCPWFRWDAFALGNGITFDDIQTRQWDSDGSICEGMNRQERDGDPEGEGVVW